jgi:AT hook motif
MSIDPVTGKRGRGRPRKSEELVSMLPEIPGAFLNRGNIVALICSMCGRGDEVDMNGISRYATFHCAHCGGRAFTAPAGDRGTSDPMDRLAGRRAPGDGSPGKVYVPVGQLA